MSEAHETIAIRAALQSLIDSDIPSQHKRVLIEAVMQALRDGQAAEIRLEAMKPPNKEWQPHEIGIVSAFLADNVARSWQHADEIVMRLASELHRDPTDVRKKATELGFGSGVDYRLARTRVVAKDA